MRKVFPVYDISNYFNVLDGHVVDVPVEPHQVLHEVEFAVGCLARHCDDASGRFVVVVADPLVNDVVG